ncbi:MAG: hypothetical protein GDA51_02355 [Ekhidna sp.]|nr:hypothetical protein [Ekhidna sp.]
MPKNQKENSNADAPKQNKAANKKEVKPITADKDESFDDFFKKATLIKK